MGGELLFAVGLVELGEVDGDEVRPVEVSGRFGYVLVVRVCHLGRIWEAVLGEMSWKCN